MQTYIPTAYQRKLVRLDSVSGAVLDLSTDFTALESQLGTDLSTATWTATGCATVSSEATSGNVASAVIEVNTDGIALIECAGLFADGQIRKQQYELVARPAVTIQ